MGRLIISSFLLLFSLLSSFPPISPSSPSPSPSLPPNQTLDLIQQTCKNTKYYDLCVSTLKSDSSSPKADTKGLALIMIRVGMANATATNTYLSSKMLSSVTNNTVLKKVMKECADKYQSANEALQNSVQDLGTEMYDYAYMHVMAAKDYPNACRNAFKRYPGLAYPKEIAVREEGLKNICDVVMGIIDALGS